LLSAREALSRFRSYPVYTTGSTAVDSLLDGGYRAGRVYMVYGKSNSGKSQLAMQAALCAARSGAKSLFVDSEGTFRPERVQEMASARGWSDACVLKDIVYLRCDSAAVQTEVVRRMPGRRETTDCRLVVVDTLTRNFTLDLPGRENMPDRQGALNVHLSEMARDAFLNRRAYLLTNRVTFDREDADVGVGGKTVSQLVHRSLHLERDGRLVKVTETERKETRLLTLDIKGIGA
jgi:DNA repair protein RadA